MDGQPSPNPQNKEVWRGLPVDGVTRHKGAIVECYPNTEVKVLVNSISASMLRCFSLLLPGEVCDS